MVHKNANENKSFVAEAGVEQKPAPACRMTEEVSDVLPYSWTSITAPVDCHFSKNTLFLLKVKRKHI